MIDYSKAYTRRVREATKELGISITNENLSGVVFWCGVLSEETGKLIRCALDKPTYRILRANAEQQA